MAESYCGVCRRVVVLDAGGRCRSCKGPRRKPIAEGWDVRSKEVKAALEAMEQAPENAQAPENSVKKTLVECVHPAGEAEVVA